MSTDADGAIYNSLPLNKGEMEGERKRWQACATIAALKQRSAGKSLPYRSSRIIIEPRCSLEELHQAGDRAEKVLVLVEDSQFRKSMYKTLVVFSKDINGCSFLTFQEISHDTRRFRFALPSPEHILGLPIGMFYMKKMNTFTCALSLWWRRTDTKVVKNN